MFFKRTIRKELEMLKHDDLVNIATKLDIKIRKGRKDADIVESIVKKRKKDVQREWARIRLGKLGKDKDLKEIARDLNLKNYANLGKPGLIKKILAEASYKRIAKQLGVSWWQRNKDAIGLHVTIWIGLWGFFGFPSVSDIFDKISGYSNNISEDYHAIVRTEAEKFYHSAEDYFKTRTPPSAYHSSEFSGNEAVTFKGMFALDNNRNIIGKVIVSHNASNDVFTLHKNGLISPGNDDKVRISQGTVSIKNALSKEKKRTASVFGIRFIRIPGGCYEMGCVSETNKKDEKCLSYETPLHIVCVDGFWMGKSEVTEKQWHAVMGGSGSDISEKRSANNVTFPGLTG